MLVKVWNDNKHPYSEKYMGKQITIEPKSFVKMDSNEAAHFLGTMPGNLKRGADGLQLPETYKMLRIEKTDGALDIHTDEFKCMACSENLGNKKALEAHIEAKHTDVMVDDDAIEKIQAKRRGRPKKDVKDDSGTD